MTEQEKLWVDDFGGEYLKRNAAKDFLGRVALFYSALKNVIPVFRKHKFTLFEYGCNNGLNLFILYKIYGFEPKNMAGIDINRKAIENKILSVDMRVGSIFDYMPEKQYDIVLTRGLLIHLNPDKIKEAYQKLYDTSKKYILICEYYNPTPVTVPYRGKERALFKRDFAGEMLDLFPDLSLMDYGFIYHRDEYPQDDVAWFLLKKGA